MIDVVRIATRQPITVSVGVLFCLLSGVIALKIVPVQMTPEVEDTIIAVTTTWENASPQEVESEIVDPQEEKLQGLSNLRSITSTSSRGEGVIRLEFQDGVNKIAALREVSDKLREVPSYPENVDEPVIEASDPESQDYIAWYILTTDDKSVDVRTLLDFAEDRIKPQLERVPGMSEVNVLGGREREVQILFDPAKLAQHRITISNFVNALIKGNNNFSGGALKQGKSDVRIRAVGRFSSTKQIQDLVIRRDDAGPVLVSDVADVALTYKEPLSYVRTNGNYVLAMNFQREPGTNVIDIMDDLEATVADLQRPGGVLDLKAQELGINGKLALVLAYKSTNYIKQALGLVRNNIYIGGSLAVVVLLLFLRSLRSLAIISLSIPISIIGAIVMMVMLGRSINVVSLAGMAFAVGMVVDNCIVVLENIYRYLEMGKSRLEAAYEGTREVAGAVLASTLTTIVVFIPILLVTDQVGQLFRDIALAIITAVGFSYVVAITLIPSAGALLLYRDGKEKKKRTKDPLLQRFIHWVNGSLISQILIVVIFVGVTVAGTIALVPPLDYLPKGNRNITFGLMIPPPGYNIDQFAKMGKRVEETIRPFWENKGNLSAVPIPYSASGQTVTPAALDKYFLVATGNVLFHGAISKESHRGVDNIALFQHATRPSQLPGTYAFAFQFPLFRIGGSTGSAIKINLTGADLDQVSNSTGALFGTIMQAFGPGTVRPDPANFNVNPKELQIVPDYLKLAEFGMSPSDLGQAVQAVSDGIVLGDYDLSNDLIDLKLKAINSEEDTYLGALPSVPVATPIGSVTSLDKLGTFKWIEAAEQIKRAGRRRAVVLEVTPPDNLPLEEAMESIGQKVEDLRAAGAISPGVEVSIEGTAGKLRLIRRTLLGDGSLAGTLTSSFFLAFAAVYLLMCVLFQSWTQPFIIMFTVPLATFGGFIGLALLHRWSVSDRYMPVQNLDMLTILGFVILVGVVVNNAILIVAQTNNLLKNNPDTSPDDPPMSARTAIALAVQSRVRPIFMSMLTSVGGMLPLVLNPGPGSELYRGLGGIMVGGMLLSTLFTLILVPVLLSVNFSLYLWLKRFRGQMSPAILVLLTFSVGSGCKTSETLFDPDELGISHESWINSENPKEAANLHEWWRRFDDPVLGELINRARRNNSEITASLQRIAQFRAILGQEQARRFPGTTIGAAYARSEFTETIKDNFQSSEALSNWDIFARTAWEIDFFGRVKEIIEAADKDLLATEQDLHDLHVIVSADVAEQYFYYRSIREREVIAAALVDLYRENLEFTRARAIAGRATGFDINNATEYFAQQQAALIDLEKEGRQTLNRVSFLLGEPPGTVDNLLADSKPMPAPKFSVATGVPAELLRRRPDIRKVEYLISAEAARLKIAQAEYYPKFLLTGNIGMNSTRLRDLLSENSYQYSFGPNFEWRILSSRRVGREVRAQEAKLQEEIENYRTTVLQALEEVESGLIGFHKEQERLRLLQEIAESANASVALAKSLNAKGIEDFQFVVNAVINFRKSEEQVVLSKNTTYATLVQIYKALGGGWDPAAAAPEDHE